MNALIGSTGVIGTVLQQSIAFDHVFNSKNIEEILNYKFDTVYCSAPSGNRLIANQNPSQDFANIKQLSDIITQIKLKKLILISTVDTQVKDSPYAQNRKYLEQAVEQLPDYHIIRLCSLIDSSIKKNILYDLKHNTFVENINSGDICQWYPLQQLHNDIEYTVNNNIRDINLTSEPITNKDIIEQFFPDQLSKVKNIKLNEYNLLPYRYSKQKIFLEIARYIND